LFRHVDADIIVSARSVFIGLQQFADFFGRKLAISLIEVIEFGHYRVTFCGSIHVYVVSKQARREPQRGPGNHRGALSQPHSVCAEIETPKASRGKRRGEGCPPPSDCMGFWKLPGGVRGGVPAENLFYLYLGQKEATWNTFFNIFERRRGPNNIAGPGKTPPSRRACKQTFFLKLCQA